MQTVGQWLEQLGLAQYTGDFERNAVDLELVRELTDPDLEKLGVLALGHRKKLLKAISELNGTGSPGATSQGVSGQPPLERSLGAEAQRRQLTVMFCDLVGSTELATKLDPEQLRDLMLAYQRACREVIEPYEGHVAQYLGDGLMVYFGWPRAHEDDPVRAIRAGLGVVQAVSQLNVPTPISARVGIHTGLVVVGETGQGDASIPKAAVGETPNVAARLQGLAQPGTVVVSEHTLGLAEGLFDYADLGAPALKGMTEPLRVFRVSGARTVESRFEAARGHSTLSPLVGREEELALLLRRWQEAKEGEGQVVLVGGEPGIGKSRLTRALRERLERTPYTPLRYQCSSYHVNSALYPVIGQFERAAGFTREDMPEQRLDKLQAVLVGSKAQVSEVAPLFAAMLSLPTDRYPGLNLSPQKRKENTLEALAGQVEALAKQQPVLMIYEDVHWLDATSQEALDLLVPRLQRLPVLLLVTCRPEYTPKWAEQAHVTVLGLSRLGRRDGAELVAKLTVGKSLPPEVLEQILAHTDGVPLFVEELTKSILESKLLRDAGDSYVLDGPLPALAIPTTLRDSLIARLDHLAPIREVAQIGACIGREFSYELLAAVSPFKGTKLDEALAQLTGSGLLFRRGMRPDATYTFKHALIQDAAYDSLLKSRRTQLHILIAQTLERDFSERVTNEPETLAHHYMEAALFEQAAVYWRRAAERASARFANAEAIAHARNGLAALALVPPAVDRIDDELALRLSLVASLRISDRHDEALEELARAEALATEHNRMLALSRIHHARGNIYFPLGQVDRCFAEHEAALRFARQAHSTEDEARALGGICDARYMAGQLRQAHDYANRCVTLCRTHGLEAIEVAYLPMRAAAHMYCLQFEQALDDCRSVIDLAARVGQARAEIVSRSTSSSVLLEQHEFALAEEHARRGLDVADRIGARRLIPVFSSPLALLRLHAGDRAGAVKLLETGWAISRETGVTQVGPGVLGALALATIDPDRRREALREGQAILERGCASHNYFWFYRSAIEVSLAGRDWDAADAYARALERYFHAEPVPWPDFVIARGQALAELGRRGPHERVVVQLRRLRDEAARLGLKTELEPLDAALESCT